jgi:SEC-C motif
VQFSETTTDTASLPPLALDRESFARLVAKPALCGPQQIRAALTHADYDDAAIRALAASKLGCALPAELVADVLVGVDRIEVFLPLARQTTADRLLDLLGHGRFADEPSGIAQTSYTVFALWQLQSQDVVRRSLLPRLRRLARCAELPELASGFVAWLVTELDDPQLRSIYENRRGAISDQQVKTFGHIMREFWNVPIDGIVALLPAKVEEPTPSSVPVRAAPRPGRNEPCPCGSGKKFKKCHGEIAAVPTSPRITRAERLRAVEPQLHREHIDRLSRADLAELDASRLPGDALVALIRRQGRLRDWHRASLAHEEYVRRFGNEMSDELLGDVIFSALLADQLDVAAQLLAQRHDPTSGPLLELELALATSASGGVLGLLEQLARTTLRQHTVPELADVVVRRLPALGILVARGALATSSLWHGESLLDWIEGARDDLQLPPGDPAQRVFDALGGERKAKAEAKLAEAERARLNQAAEDLQAHLDDVTSRLKTMEHQAAERERELERALRAAAESQQRVSQVQTEASQRELRAQRQKIEELQAGIRERNEERAELRRQLADLIETDRRARPRQPEPTQASESEEDDEGVDDLPEGTVHPVRLLRFRAAAESAFGSVPRDVAAIAMRMIGALAAGDATAWRKVKQAKDMPRQVIIARVGIHYRLLLRTDEGPLEILDLVTRQNEEIALKRLRS